MPESANGSNALRVPPDAVDFELRINYNVISHAFGMQGFDKDPLIALAMLEWAKSKLQRVVARNELAEEMARQPLIAPGRMPRV